MAGVLRALCPGGASVSRSRSASDVGPHDIRTGVVAAVIVMPKNLKNRNLLPHLLLVVGWAVIGLPYLVGCSTVESGREKIGTMFGSSTRTAEERLLADGSLAPMEGQDEFDAAKKLYAAKNFEEAEKAFKKVTKDYEDRPIEEEALFMLAESQFQQERFPRAEDSYNRLLSKYEGSRYMDQATFRLFTIAREWLDGPAPVQEQEVIQASGGENPESGVVKIDKQKRPFPLIPNLTDNKRPAFDTDGRALEALKSIWLNHPTGKLADDAVMLSGVHHYRTGDYLEAGHFFEMLREQYPNSPHAANAYQFGAHVEQLIYQGPAYDGRGLDKAIELTESTLSLFPDKVNRERLQKSLAYINHEKARKSWERVQYRLGKGQREAAEINCVALLQDHPDSAFAELAKQTMEELRAERLKRSGKDPSEEMVQPELPKYEESYDGEVGEIYIGDSVEGETVESEDTMSPPDFEDVPDLFDNLPTE